MEAWHGSALLARARMIRNEERGSGTRNEDPERGTRIRNKERDSGTGHEIPYDLVQMVL